MLKGSHWGATISIKFYMTNPIKTIRKSILSGRIHRPRASNTVKRYYNCKESWAKQMWYCLVSRILRHMRITDTGYSPVTFRHYFPLQVYAASFQWRLLIFIRKNLRRRVLEVNKEQVPLKSYSLKIRIFSDPVNWILTNKLT